ncbi:GntR family transcriptional regulator (plasmid) [Streptomyces sp. BH-SS-21]|uniref:GntR family transcriptional regulator n=1 Tax=Streptomyces liliiviolaceus TaxID=2823109 RepID=A0A940YF22_9ACTN|nr:GntR family transcriptional regulator [Streptomyces liliiviolaceus]MBQ0855714.1 GntR family transcriptional regulator [Streptomyces liliiviolaceus]
MSDEAGAQRTKVQHIADELKAAIERGDYEPGDRLPGENALAAQYGVASLTARRALKILRTEGLVESRKGAGARVLSFQPIRRRGIPRLAREQWGSGRSIWSTDDVAPDVDQIAVLVDTTPPPHISNVLDLAPGEVACVRSRRYVVDGRPVMLAASYMPQALVAGSPITQADTGPGGLYARLADLGHAPVRFREEIRVRLPSTDEATRLSIPTERAVIKLARTAFDAAGRAVEVNEMTLDSAAYVLDYEFDA